MYLSVIITDVYLVAYMLFSEQYYYYYYYFRLALVICIWRTNEMQTKSFIYWEISVFRIVAAVKDIRQKKWSHSFLR
jgi:hypothetical protein